MVGQIQTRIHSDTVCALLLAEGKAVADGLWYCNGEFEFGTFPCNRRSSARYPCVCQADAAALCQAAQTSPHPATAHGRGSRGFISEERRDKTCEKANTGALQGECAGSQKQE